MGNLVKETPYSEITATLEVLDRYGVNRDDLTRIRSNHGFAKDLTQFIRQTEHVIESVSNNRARSIMGKNFFGVEKVTKYFEVNPNHLQLAALAEIPFSEAVLAQSKDTHVLVAVFPLSILEIRAKQGDARLFYDQSWYNQEAFAKERGETGWHLVRKTPVEDSFSKTWDEQQALLSKDDETPSARVMTYAIIGLYLATGERLFKSVWARTSSLNCYESHVLLGRFTELGLDLDYRYNDGRRGDVGRASARKF